MPNQFNVACSEQGAEEKTEKLHRAQEAKRILSEPLLSGFFERQENDHLEAFKRMPIGSTIEQYQTVHHDLLAVERLRLTLQSYIQDYNMTVLDDHTKVVEGI